MRMKGVGGEIVPVQGGHIVRSTGRKDRHSKVYTAKGPRDRRVRLSAHTAIQFYDVQDRLGYDRPSKAVDWLMKKAKPAIDKLAELPPWNPPDNTILAGETEQQVAAEMTIATEQSESSSYNFQLQRQLGENMEENSGFIPSQLDSDSMRSFFPTSSTPSTMNFQNYPSDLIQRGLDPTQDLGLSLHSYQHNLFQTQSHGESSQTNPNQLALFANYERMVSCNGDASISTTDSRGMGGGEQENGGGFVFNSPPLTQQILLGQSSAVAFAQRGTLQSSFSPFVRAWDDLPMAAERAQQLNQPPIFGLPMFRFPARIHGEEEDDVVSDRPSSSSSPNSTHH
ncbi:hypothetical protein UlMin_020583 [Ulmus minor]